MMMNTIAFSLVLFVLLGNLVESYPQQQKVTNEGKHWAVLVAGSSGWYNYRHQSDVCHAYQIVRKNGIPPEQIITMMYNDIASNDANPTPGKIINHPNGPDVYAGVVIDYQLRNVTPEIFLSVLKGDKKGANGGKVLESGPDDFVFVNMVDHGAPGIFAFPSTYLHAKDLLSTIEEMNQQKRFKQMVIYVESCESGSLFTNLPKNVNIYTTTASNAGESSYACYYDAKRQTYLGDVYSVKWMEDTDSEDVKTETLQKQFEIVKKETTTSHVQEFGDLNIANSPVDRFEGDDNSNTLRFRAAPLPKAPLNPVASEDVTTSILRQSGDHETLAQVLKEHATIKCQMNKIVNLTAKKPIDAQRYLKEHNELVHYQCYIPVAEKYLATCVASETGSDGYHLRQMYALVNLCQDNLGRDDIIAAIEDVCGDGPGYCA